MDVTKLQGQLKVAKIVLGEIERSSKDFFETYDPAPVGAIMHDFDFYSSTAVGLRMLEVDERFFLPRVFCYFDDTTGSELELYNDYTGERLAINEFNQTHDHIKLALPYHLLSEPIRERWHHRIWICHFFTHSRYDDFVSEDVQQLSLDEEP